MATGRSGSRTPAGATSPAPDPILGGWAMRRAKWNLALGAALVVLAPVLALFSGEVLVVPVLGGLGVLLVGLGLAGRWMLVERRGLASPPGTRENRVVMTATGLLGTLGCAGLTVHGLAGGGTDEVVAGVGGAVLLGGLTVAFARPRGRSGSDPLRPVR